MSELRPAARYLRMSTDNQRYSLSNQAAVIDAYALEHGFKVVRSYEDAGRSGVTTRGRDGLRRLLAEVLGGQAPFGTVLVLDVSRWGRFQNPDEAAHYEFVCRDAGVHVTYCAEAFGDGVTGAIVKQLKRIMAGEYSRELSDKSRLGKRKQTLRGYAVGGPPPYGFGRQTVEKDGAPGRSLAAGERKSRREQNVRYAWGPPEEVANVRRVFHLYVRARRTSRAIADELNADGRSWRGEPWTVSRVLGLLKCELTIGEQVYNTNISTIGRGKRQLPRGDWRRTTVGLPMIPHRLFRAAGRIRRRTMRRERARAVMIDDLRRILREKGRLSVRLIRADDRAMSAHFYVRDFGSLAAAYRLAGFDPEPLPALRNREGGAMTRAEVLAGLRRLHREQGCINATLIGRDRRLPHRLLMYREFGCLPAAYAQAGLPLSRSGRRVQRVQLNPGPETMS